MKEESIWLQNIKFDEPKQIDKNEEVDVLIIGGGMTGLSTAYHLRNSKLKVCLVERNLIAHEISSRTTGKLTFLQDNIYTKLQNKAKIYYESQKEAIEIVKQIIKDNNIECDLLEADSYIYTINEKEINKIKKEEEKLKELNIEYKIHKKLPIDLSCKYAISVKNTYVFHPIKYLKALKNIIEDNNIKVYENSCVSNIKKDNDKYICKVNNYYITANKIVIASHYPYFLDPFFMPFRTYLERSYLSASKVNDIKDFSAITLSKPIISMRYHKDNKNNYFIYLKGSHNLCCKYDYKKNFDNLTDDIKNMNIKPKYIWSNIDIITEDYLPYIGYIQNNMLIGTGYNTWGMTNGSLAGKIISDLILNKNNKYKELFNPKRSIKLIDILKYPIFVCYSIKSFIENKIIKNKKWYQENVKFTKIDGKDVAIYIDENKKEHIVYNLCPHLKCSLVFNEKEKTWDCPCHGSRFDIDGKCIFGPSNKDIGFKKIN